MCCCPLQRPLRRLERIQQRQPQQLAQPFSLFQQSRQTLFQCPTVNSISSRDPIDTWRGTWPPLPLLLQTHKMVPVQQRDKRRRRYETHGTASLERTTRTAAAIVTTTIRKMAQPQQEKQQQAKHQRAPFPSSCFPTLLHSSRPPARASCK